MRRLGLVLVGLGVFLVVAAAMLRFYAAERLVLAPLDQFSETVSEATDVTYLDVSALQVREGREFVATRTVRGDVPAGDRDTAVYDVFVKILDPEKPGVGEEQLVSATTDRVAFDRRTSEAENCCDENVNGDPVEHEGIEYKFPFGAEKKTYQYFDTSLLEATDMVFVSEEELEGLTVYKYEQTIEPTKIAELDVPGTLVGRDEPSLTVDRYYSNVRTVFVEPTSGVIIRGEERQLSTLREGGEELITITEANLAFNDETMENQADAAREAISSSSLVTTTGPLVGLVFGLAFLVGGAALALTGRGRRSSGHRATRPGESPAGPPRATTLTKG